MGYTKTEIAGYMLILLGILIYTLVTKKYLKARATDHWPGTEAKLLSDDLKDIVLNEGSIEELAKKNPEALAKIEYQYVVEDEAYLGSRVTLTDKVISTVKSLEKLQYFYKGKSEIKAYYNPNNITESLLIRGPTIFILTPLITGSVLLGLGLYLAYFS